MKVIWTDGAVEDLTEIVEYIKRDSPEAARRLAKHIFEKALSLGSMPRGHKRKPDGAWELLMVPWPYVLVYEIVSDAVLLEGVRHASRDTRQ